MKVTQYISKILKRRDASSLFYSHTSRNFGNNMARGPTASYEDDEFLPD